MLATEKGGKETRKEITAFTTWGGVEKNPVPSEEAKKSPGEDPGKDALTGSSGAGRLSLKLCEFYNMIRG